MPNQKYPDNNLDELILSNVPSPSTALLIVSEWYGQGRYDAVIKACRDILRLYPDDIRLRRLACLAYSALDFDREALEQTEEIIRRLESLTDIYLLRAKIFNHLDEKRKALEALGIYLAHRPGDEAALAVLEELRRSDPPVARVDEDPADMEPEPPPAMVSATIAELYLSQGLVDEAVKTYRHVVARNPDDENSRRRLRELENEAPAAQGNGRRQTESPDGSVCRKVLEGWREKCRKLFDPTVSQKE